MKKNITLLIISLLLTLLFWSSSGTKESFAASIMDAASTCTPGTATSFTWPHTVSGNDRLLIVTPTNKSPSFTIATSVTFNGIKLTRQRIWSTFAAGGQIATGIWTLVDPPTGTHDIVVSFLHSVEAVCGASSWTGVNQTTPLGTMSDVAAWSDTTATSSSVSSVPGETIVDFLTISASTGTSAKPASSQTQLWNTKGASILSASSSKAGAATTTSASTTTSWTLSDSQASIILAVPIKPSAAASPLPPPPAPTISTPACINSGYSGSGVTISWTNSGVTWVDIDTQSSIAEPYYHKAVSSVNSTTAPNGFNAAFPSDGTLGLNPAVSYYVRTYNGIQNSPVAAFSIPACSSPPPPGPVPPPPPPPPPPAPATTVTKHPTLQGNQGEENIPFDGTLDHIYHINGNLTIDNCATSTCNTGTKTGVVFVEQALNINKNYTYSSNTTGTVFVVKGDVNIDQSVTRIDAVIISQGTICTASQSGVCPSLAVTSQQLTVNGSFISLNEVSPIRFRRTLLDNSQPAEKINHQSKYVVILKDLYSDTLQRWSEIP